MKIAQLGHLRPQNNFLKVSYPPLKKEKKCYKQNKYVKKSINKLINKNTQIEETFKDAQEDKKIFSKSRKSQKNQRLLSEFRKDEMKFPGVRNFQETQGQLRKKAHSKVCKSSEKFINESRDLPLKFARENDEKKTKLRVISEQKKTLKPVVRPKIFFKNRQFEEQKKKIRIFSINAWISLSQKLKF